MPTAVCVEGWVQKPDTNRENDILKCIKPIIKPHYYRHNCVTMLCEAGVDPLIVIKIVATPAARQPQTSTPVSGMRF